MADRMAELVESLRVMSWVMSSEKPCFELSIRRIGLAQNVDFRDSVAIVVVTDMVRTVRP